MLISGKWTSLLRVLYEQRFHWDPSAGSLS
uniref:Uncharacterized protein n=1 Tax=Physcomitrium patens TaxID=3218 RepID=A0A2K1ISE9_PHYPA|nr:hypothetical protein PHYPA_026332 [Physcomitrium patens]